MRILRLEIKNLASLDREEGETIDFEQGVLGESAIFSIVGPTGSGKSTLLDAICLALYNHAPRYPKMKTKNDYIAVMGQKAEGEAHFLAPTDCRNILSRGKSEAYSKLTFRANDGTVYRAEWYVKKNKVTYNREVLSLYKLHDEGGMKTEEEADWNDLPRIIGLEYDQFLKTVLIAQGSFAQFLTASDEVRCALLEKLVGNGETYAAIAQRIREQKDKAAEAYKVIESEMKAVSMHRKSDEEIAQLRDEIAQLETREKAVIEELKTVETALQWYADEVQKAMRVKAQAEAVGKAEEALCGMGQQISRLSLHDALDEAIDTLRDVRRLQAEAHHLQQEMKERQLTMTHWQAQLQAEETLLTAQRQKAEETRKALETADPHIKKARELRTQLQGTQKVLADKQQAQQTARQEEQKAHKDLQQNAMSIAKAEQAEAQAKAAQEQLATASEAQKLQLAQRVAEANDALAKAQEAVKGLQADVLVAAKTQADNRVRDIEKAWTLAIAQRKDLEEQQEKLGRQEALTQGITAADIRLGQLEIPRLEQELQAQRVSFALMTSERWEQHRQHLVEGEACPLCGATSHRYKADPQLYAEEAEVMSGMLRRTEQLLETQRTEEKQLLTLKEGNARELKSIGQRIAQLEEALRGAGKELQVLREAYPDLPDGEAEVSEMLEVSRKAQQEATAALMRYNQQQDEISRLSNLAKTAAETQRKHEEQVHEEAVKAQQRTAETTTQLAAHKAQTQPLEQQLLAKQQAAVLAAEQCRLTEEEITRLRQAYVAELDGEDPDKQEQRLTQAHDEAAQRVATLTENIGQQRTVLGEMTGAQEEQQRQLEEKQQMQGQRQDALDEWLKVYNASETRLCEVSLADVEALLTAPDNWEMIRQQREALTKAAHEARALHQHYLQQHTEHQQGKPEVPQDVLQQRQVELKAINLQPDIVDRKMVIGHHEEAVRMMGERASEMEQLQQANADWEDIWKAIGSDGKYLRKIAQCYSLGFLVAYANEEIRKFNSRYELLHVKNSLGLRVIDHDRADAVREITSLSGGETFIVSLGLALGLSALSSRSISFDNLFIDEGFGTLDPDTLATVIDSLAMLQSSAGKKVGVISHTDTMSDRISTQIRIVRNGSSGSSRVDVCAG